MTIASNVHLVQKERSSLFKKDQLTSSQADMQEVSLDYADSASQAFAMKVDSIEIDEKALLAVFYTDWTKRHGYGAEEVARLEQIIAKARDSLQGKLDWRLSLEEILHIWVSDRLKQHFGDEQINEPLTKEMTQRLQSYSVESCAAIFHHLDGVPNLETLGLFLEVAQTFKVAEQVVITVFSTHETSEHVTKNLLNVVFHAVLTDTFPHYKRATELASQLYKSGWRLASLVKMLNGFATEAVTGNRISSLKAVEALELIRSYRLKENDRDQQNRTIQHIFSHVPVGGWPAELGKLAVYARLGQRTVPVAEENARETLLKMLLEANKGDKEVIALVQRQFRTISAAFDDDDQVFSIVTELVEPISSWQQPDILVWKQAANAEGAQIGLLEKLLVIKRAVWLAYGYTPRDVQLMSVAILAEASGGMLAEIATGEGKSLIAAMFAVIKALSGKKVDIVTSSAVLARRDAHEQASFYQLFGLTVADNIYRGVYKPCYEKDIVYGDVLHFVVDLLDRQTNGSTPRGSRPMDTVLIDEVDSMFVDQSSHVTMLTRGVPGFEYLEPILVALWRQLEEVNRHLAYDAQSAAWLWIEGEFEYRVGKIQLVGEQSRGYVIGDREKLTRSILKAYLSKLLDPVNPLLRIPNSLISFVLFQQDNWIDSAMIAQRLIEGKNYVVSQDKYGNAVISVVDYKNTGVVHENMQWFNGLHQFLEIKHGLKIKAESVMNRFMSNMAFFKRYQGGLYGMTGTLGALEEKACVKETYGATFFKVPTHKPKQFVELPLRILKSYAAWQEAILASIKQETANGRAVLLILETINEVKIFAQELKAIGYPEDRVRLYSRNDQPETAADKKIDAGDVMIATNLAGRGTDLKTTPELEKNGGLHVCIGYLPANLRVQLQAYGRTARQGKQGTGQMIINQEIAVEQLRLAYPWYQMQNGMAYLLQWRDLAEQDRVLKDRYIRNDIAAIKDQLFTRFTEFSQELAAKAASPRDVMYDLRQIEDLWGVWLKERYALTEYSLNKAIQTSDIQFCKQKNAELRQQLFNELQAFIEHIRQAWHAQRVIQNTGYLTNKAWGILRTRSHQADAYLAQATQLDPIFSFTASYVRARLSVETSEDKQLPYTYLAEAQRKVHVVLSQLEGMLAVLNLRTIEGNENALSKQIISKMAVLNRLSESIRNAMTVIAESSGEEKIRVKSAFSLKEMMRWDGQQENELEEFDNIGLVRLFELEAYKESKDWSGTLFSFVLGAVQIVVGVMIAPFMPNFGASVIVGGVSDVISSIRSVLTGRPIDLNQYFSAKGIEYAVSVITAGLNSAKEALLGTKEIGVKAAATEASKEVAKEVIVEAIKDEFIRRGIAAGIAYAAEEVLEKGLGHYEKDIAESVRKEVDLFISSYSSQIEFALFHDEIIGSEERQNEIYNQALTILNSYRAKYHSAAARIIKGVGAGVASRIHPLGGVALTTADIIHSTTRISEVTQEFSSEFGQYLQDAAQGWGLPDEALKRKLNHVFTTAQSSEIIYMLNTKQVIQNHQVVNCGGIRERDIQAYAYKMKMIVALCFEVERAGKSDKYARIEQIKKHLAVMITHAITRMIKGEVLSPLTSMVGMWGGNKLFASMQEVQNKVIDTVVRETVLTHPSATEASQQEVLPSLR